jgi:hypothetical protein
MKNRTISFIYSLSFAFTILFAASCNDDKGKVAEVSNEPPVAVTAVKLLADYEKDQDAADKLYKGKKLIVSGEVLSVTPKHDGASTVLINSPESSIGSIQCLFAADKAAQTAKLVREQQTSVTGLCEGMDDIGVSVIINNSTIE